MIDAGIINTLSVSCCLIAKHYYSIYGVLPQAVGAFIGAAVGVYATNKITIVVQVARRLNFETFYYIYFFLTVMVFFNPFGANEGAFAWRYSSIIFDIP